MGDYFWRTRKSSLRSQRQQQLATRMEAVYDDHRHVCGSPRVYQVLTSYLIASSLRLGLRIMPGGIWSGGPV